MLSLVSLAFSGVSNPSGGLFFNPLKREKTMSDEIRIYVSHLAAYNNGKLHGVWINACDDINEIWEQIKAMLNASPEGFAEEYAIHDYEGFGGYALSEHEDIEATHEGPVSLPNTRIKSNSCLKGYRSYTPNEYIETM
jgi:hypothetical protein